MPKRPDASGPARETALERRIGWHFRNPGLLAEALTHRSASPGRGARMERLEFLGDAVLGAVIAASLFERFPDHDEGDLTRMRAALVRREALLAVSRDWGLGECLVVGEGERDAGGRVRSASIRANAVEAVIGAVFVDGGWEAARAVVLAAWRGMLETVSPGAVRDAKTRLQEYTQARGLGLPEYVVRDHGVGRQPRFVAECFVDGASAGRGAGPKKKAAEMDAAADALAHLPGVEQLPNSEQSPDVEQSPDTEQPPDVEGPGAKGDS